MSGLGEVIQARCESFGPRRDGLEPQFIVLHYTAMESAEAALERLCDPEVEVSAHYLIGEDGRVWQMVDEAMRAWHAGAGSWRGLEDINSRSIGIELANRGDHPFSEPQMAALEALMRGIMARWSIGPEDVIGHSCMAPGRKIDPGPRFDWQRLARQGLAVWPDVGAAPGVDAARFRDAALAYGFPDVPDDLLLQAVRLRFRPWGCGALGGEDMAVAEALAAQSV